MSKRSSPSPSPSPSPYPAPAPLQELRLFGSLLGIIGGGVALLSLLRGLLRHSHLLLRVCSTCLYVVVAIAVPYLLQHTSLTNALLLAMAGGYLLASLVRVPLALGYTPRATRLSFFVYDYFLGGLLLFAARVDCAAGGASLLPLAAPRVAPSPFACKPSVDTAGMDLTSWPSRATTSLSDGCCPAAIIREN